MRQSRLKEPASGQDRQMPPHEARVKFPPHGTSLGAVPEFCRKYVARVGDEVPPGCSRDGFFRYRGLSVVMGSPLGRS